jgi:hypothetical protein
VRDNIEALSRLVELAFKVGLDKPADTLSAPTPVKPVV